MDLVAWPSDCFEASAIRFSGNESMPRSWATRPACWASHHAWIWRTDTRPAWIWSPSAEASRRTAVMCSARSTIAAMSMSTTVRRSRGDDKSDERNGRMWCFRSSLTVVSDSCGPFSAVGCGALQAVQDQVQPEVELTGEVVAGPEHVLDGELREVRIPICREVPIISPTSASARRRIVRSSMPISSASASTRPALGRRPAACASWCPGRCSSEISRIPPDDRLAR